MKEKQGTDRERTSKSQKMDLSTNVFGNPALDSTSLVMPNMELGALAETKFQGCGSDGEEHSCLLQGVWNRHRLPQAQGRCEQLRSGHHR